MPDILRDKYGEINPLYPRPQFLCAKRLAKESATGYRYIRVKAVPRRDVGGFFMKYEAYLPPACAGETESSLGVFDTLDEAVTAQRNAILKRGINALYILDHMELSED